MDVEGITPVMSQLPFLIVISVLLVFPSILSAEDKAAEADAAFKEGVSLYGQEKYEQAADAFRRANELRFNWKILYNIGQSESSAKRFGEALLAFEEYMVRGGDDIYITRRDEVIEEIQRLKLLVGYLEIEAPNGAMVYVDGKEKGGAPLAGPVPISAAIAHKVRVVLNHRPVIERNVRVSGGQTLTLRAE
jgi:hypothetical protein